MTEQISLNRFRRGFIFGLGVAAVIFFIWHTKGQPSWCAPSAPSWLPWAQPEEHCVREWISALGGWAAVAVAIPTIGFLAKQLRDADRFHRQTVAMTLERNLTLAKRMTRRCGNERRRIDRIKLNLSKMNAVAGAAGSSTILSPETAKMVLKLIENFEETDLDDFEAITFVGATYLRSARKALAGIQKIADSASKANGGRTISGRELKRVDSAVMRASSHLKRLDDHAKEYLKKWDVA
ncbi:hypothetical protein [Rhizobium sp. 1399]|uniref:hypothetical protein n=1 Tax=Rhizobium sp. 1399 TaxID=2817758 RepID=UPI002858AFF9|nr:hypothetical protein [Rhizobium sp. 1399]MDR6667090.1 hypothetical protein [Rhizobium sp. 1399]